eukprot:c17105_g1_i1 orf=340-1458(+)
MRRKYFCLCSGGSIYTVSTVGRRMGKYMMKTRSVQKMEVSQSSLAGVRTRARALALEKQSERACNHSLTCTPTISRPPKSFQSRTPPPKNEPHYMQLRSRRLEKVSKYNEKGRKFADRRIDRASAAELSGRRPSLSHVELRLCDEELLDMPPRNSCSSRPDIALVAVSATVGPMTDAVSHSRITSPAESSMLDSDRAAPMPMQALAILERGATRMLTRNQKQDFNSKFSADANTVDMDVERVTPEAASTSGNAQRETEVEPWFGESPVIAEPSSRERQQRPNIRSEMRECSLDLLIGDVDAPVSTSTMCRSSQIRSSSAPPFSRLIEDSSSTEIESFFASAEQEERKRFINRYNFDPLTEKPLKGRYFWYKE